MACESTWFRKLGIWLWLCLLVWLWDFLHASSLTCLGRVRMETWLLLYPLSEASWWLAYHRLYLTVSRQSMTFGFVGPQMPQVTFLEPRLLMTSALRIETSKKSFDKFLTKCRSRVLNKSHSKSALGIFSALALGDFHKSPLSVLCPFALGCWPWVLGGGLWH